MKKLLCIIIVISIITAFYSCSNNNNSDTEEKNDKTNHKDISEENSEISNNGSTSSDSVPDELANKIEADWLEYLKASAIKSRSAEWATQYLTDYCSKKDVLSYRRAIAALEAAVAALEGIKLPEMQLTSDDISNAVKYGLDISYIGSYYSAAEFDAKNDAAAFNNLLIYFIDNSLWEYGLEYIELTAEFYNQKAQIELNELILSTNHLLLSLGKSSYDDVLKEECALLFGDSTEFISNIAEVETAVDTCLDEYESLTEKLYELESTMLANDKIISDAIEKNDWTKVYNEAFEISNGINAVFLPETSAAYSVATYFYDEENENIIWTVAGDDLSDIPSGLLITYDAVTEQTFKEYTENLEMTWWKEYKSDSKDNKYQYMLTNGNTILCVSFKDGTLEIIISDTSTYICPSWYILYLLS